MPSFHEILIELRNALGYKRNTDGNCALYAEKAIDAFLVGEYITVFKPRCEYIEKNYEQYTQSLQNAKEKLKPLAFLPPKVTTDLLSSDPELQMIFDVEAFIGSGDFYLTPYSYKELFGKPLNQLQSQEISYYAQSEKLDKLGGRACLASFYGIYTPQELKQYVLLLNRLAKSSKSDFALSLSSDNHDIGLCYSHDEKSWLLMDANNPSQPPLPSNESDDSAIELASYLLVFLFDDDADVTGFHTRLYTTGNRKESIQSDVDAMIIDKTFAAIHNITPERVNLVSIRGGTLGWFAAQAGDASALQEIIKSDPAVNLNQPNNIGVTPVYMSAQNGHGEALGVLISATTPDGQPMVDLNQPDNKGATPAFVAAKRGYANILRLLAAVITSDGQVVVDLNRPCHDGATPVYIAVQEDNIEELQVLVDERMPDGQPRVELNQSFNNGSTPAFMAVHKNHIKALQILVDAKTPDGLYRVDLNIPNNEGATPIYLAAREGNTKALHILVEAKMLDGQARVNLNQPTNNGETPVFIAVMNNHVEALQVLAEAKMPDGRLAVDFNLQDEDGRTPAYIAAENGHAQALRVLIAVKTLDDKVAVDLNQPDNTGETPALRAVQESQIEVLQLLVEAKASDGQFLVNFNQADNDGVTPAFRAASKGLTEVLAILVEAKTQDGNPRANLNLPCNNGLTPIHIAAANGHLEAVRLLIKSGVDLNCLYKGYSPLQLAENKGHVAVVELIAKALGHSEPDHSLTNEVSASSNVSSFFHKEAILPSTPGLGSNRSQLIRALIPIDFPSF